MDDTIFFEIHKDLPRESPGRVVYTRRAFQMLPPLHNPKILDIGCGTGPSTIELAKLTDGTIVGIDIHQPYLDRLKKKAKEMKLSHRITTRNLSMTTMDFPSDYFDILWAEGSIYIIGFKKGLQQWRRYLKTMGFLVVHEMVWLKTNPPQEIREYWENIYPEICTISENLDLIPQCGYHSIGSFALPEDTWWDEYYGPLQERITMLQRKYEDNSNALAVLQKEQEEIDLYRDYSQWYGSAFFIMQKTEG
jgi:ubiquinone/menaquinone biosynthesis C-methylase UbiE